MEQNTPEWINYRRNKIGASDAIIIMGESPWKTPLQLFDEKIGWKETPMNSSMQRGHDLEETARHMFESMTGLLVVPKVKEHCDLTWMIASLDGIDLDEKNIVEIKCPNKEDHSIAKDGKIPTKYYPQLQHQMEVTGLEMAHYFSFDGHEGVIVKVYRDDNYIKKLVAKESEFWDCMQSLTPPASSDKDYVLKNDDFWRDTVSEWLDNEKIICEREKIREDLRKTLIMLSQGKNSKGSGVQVSKVYRKGNVDYSKIPELIGVDLETHRKPTIETWRISSV